MLAALGRSQKAKLLGETPTLGIPRKRHSVNVPVQAQSGLCAQAVPSPCPARAQAVPSPFPGRAQAVPSSCPARAQAVPSPCPARAQAVPSPPRVFLDFCMITHHGATLLGSRVHYSIVYINSGLK